jgi:hypothetical protein
LTTVIDQVDISLCQYNWYATKEIRPCRHTGTSQASTQVDIFLHREILERVLGRELKTGEFVDHIDSNPLNNVRSNLRLASGAENAKNRKLNASSTSGFKGVTKKGDKWRAQIQSDKRKMDLGSYSTPEEAHRAYCEAAKKLHGRFARTE